MSPTDPRPTPTIEDYLAIIYVLERDGGEVIAANLARSLEVTPPTVTVTLKRMERDGWLVLEGRKGIALTEAGRVAAQSVIRRHMLTEWLLARMLKVPWSQIHAEADQIEHTISEEIMAQMTRQLDDPQCCPHGNPFPGYEAVTADWKVLTDAVPGEQVIIRRIHETAEDDAALLQYLESHGVTPGAEARVTEFLPFNQTITLNINDRPVILGFPVARYIFVESEAME